jgi:hypothetical protein
LYGAEKQNFLEQNKKLDGSSDLNETHISFVEHTEVYDQKDLFCLIDLLYMKLF